MEQVKKRKKGTNKVEESKTDEPGLKDVGADLYGIISQTNIRIKEEKLEEGDILEGVPAA